MPIDDDSRAIFAHLIGVLDHVAYGSDLPESEWPSVFDMIRCLTNAELMDVLDACDDHSDSEEAEEAAKLRELGRLIRFDEDGNPERRPCTPEERMEPTLRRLDENEGDALRFAQHGYEKFGQEILDRHPEIGRTAGGEFFINRPEEGDEPAESP